MKANLRRIQEAEQHCRAALVTMKALCSEYPKNEGFQLALADAYHGVGHVLVDDPFNHARIAEAEDCLKKAIEVYGGLASRSAENAKYRNRQSESYRYLVMALGQINREKAVAAGRRGIEISEQLVKEFPSSREYPAMLASVHTNMWNTVSDRQAARAHAEQAAKIFAQLDSSSFRGVPGELEPANKSYLYEHGLMCRTMGQYFADDGDRDAARKMFEKSLAIAKELAAKYPAAPLHQNELASSLIAWSNVLEGWGDIEGAEMVLREALQRSEQSDLQKAYIELRLSGVLERQNRQEEAGKYYRSVLRLSPKNTRGPLAIWTSLFLGIAHYHLGEYSAAIESLQESMKARNGGDSFEWFYLAVANWKLGRTDEAREWNKKAISWMDANKPDEQHLRQFRALAEKLLKPDGPKDDTDRAQPSKVEHNSPSTKERLRDEHSADK